MDTTTEIRTCARRVQRLMARIEVRDDNLSTGIANGMKDNRAEQILITIERDKRKYIAEFACSAAIWLAASRPTVFYKYYCEVTDLQTYGEKKKEDSKKDWTPEQREIREGIMRIWMPQDAPLDEPSMLSRLIGRLSKFQQVALCLKLWNQPIDEDVDTNFTNVLAITDHMACIEDTPSQVFRMKLGAQIRYLFKLCPKLKQIIMDEVYSPRSKPKQVVKLVVPPNQPEPDDKVDRPAIEPVEPLPAIDPDPPTGAKVTPVEFRPVERSRATIVELFGLSEPGTHGVPRRPVIPIHISLDS